MGKISFPLLGVGGLYPLGCLCRPAFAGHFWVVGMASKGREEYADSRHDNFERSRAMPTEGGETKEANISNSVLPPNLKPSRGMVILRRGCFFQPNFLGMSLLPDVVGESDMSSQQVVGASCVAWILYYHHIFRARGVKRSHHDARSHFPSFPPKL